MPAETTSDSFISGQEVWSRAKRTIAGGSMLLSKNPDLALPGEWPAYFSRASGTTVWDLDGRPFADLGLMGLGTALLGYGDQRVDEAVMRAVRAGVASSLLAPEEVDLAELLCELHPWAEQVRFTRSGGEACAVATRIARSASGRDRVAVCGYHGWHDWYLAGSLGRDGLEGHHISGLSSAGVPSALAESTSAFRYGDASSLEALLEEGGFGAIFMEVERGHPADVPFLHEVRSLADRYDAVLIFDESTSGFRRTVGGSHLLFGVEPDLCVLGKALGNGYAIAAVLGTDAVMSSVDQTFISSTHWTERLGSAAALAAVRAMREDGAPQRANELGQYWQGLLRKSIDDSGLDARVVGIPAISRLDVPRIDPVALRHTISAHLLREGILGGTLLYVSSAHAEEQLDGLNELLAPLLEVIARHQRENVALPWQGRASVADFVRPV